MDLAAFRAIVDSSAAGIASCGEDLEKLYAYVDLDDTGSQTRQKVSKALYGRIRASFVAGHQSGPSIWGGLSGYIAEMGAAFVCASLEIIREDNRAILRAASASRAADYLLGFCPDATPWRCRRRS